MTITDKFSTYLMYQPGTGSSWIALSEIDWSWSETVTNNGGIWAGPTKQLTPGAAQQPAGGKEFPNWVNTAQNYGNQTGLGGEVDWAGAKKGKGPGA